MHHGLLVSGLVVGHEIGSFDVRLFERLADASDIAVPKDAEHPGDGAFADVTVDGPLVGEEFNERLADGHSPGC
ncbi:hypothetical protein QE430_003291 [Microbacterium testaceum]|nr:hypothetical protein [Microbacterium testaceum]